jgi:polyhydroxybutyrate depolymerase
MDRHHLDLVSQLVVIAAARSMPGAPPDWPEPTIQEFDAAEEICRFAEPLLTSVDTRRL